LAHSQWQAVTLPTQHQLYVTGVGQASQPRFVALQGVTSRSLAPHADWLILHWWQTPFASMAWLGTQETAQPATAYT
jgi:hypothetical protein